MSEPQTPTAVIHLAQTVVNTGQWNGLFREFPGLQWNTWCYIRKHHPDHLLSAPQMIQHPQAMKLYDIILNNALGRQDDAMAWEWMRCKAQHTQSQPKNWPQGLAKQVAELRTPASAMQWYQHTQNQVWWDQEQKESLEKGFEVGALYAKDPHMWEVWSASLPPEERKIRAQAVVQQWVENFNPMDKKEWRRRRGRDGSTFFFSKHLITQLHHHGSDVQQRALEMVIFHYMLSYVSSGECTKAGSLLLKLSPKSSLMDLLTRAESAQYSLSMEFLTQAVFKYPESDFLDMMERVFAKRLEDPHSDPLKKAIDQASKILLEQATQVRAKVSSAQPRKI